MRVFETYTKNVARVTMAAGVMVVWETREGGGDFQIIYHMACEFLVKAGDQGGGEGGSANSSFRFKLSSGLAQIHRLSFLKYLRVCYTKYGS